MLKFLPQVCWLAKRVLWFFDAKKNDTAFVGFLRHFWAAFRRLHYHCTLHWTRIHNAQLAANWMFQAHHVCSCTARMVKKIALVNRLVAFQKSLLNSYRTHSVNFTFGHESREFHVTPTRRRCRPGDVCLKLCNKVYSVPMFRLLGLPFV